jgi:1L-myo-inositol 1-phosphate cytidylyltransferase
MSTLSKDAARTGVVLAAGLGSRLDNGAGTVIKPLARIEHASLIGRVLRGLEIAGCGRVVIVLGHAAEQVKTAIAESYQGPLELLFAVNERFKLKNGVSVLCAREHVTGDFVLTMADHILDDAILLKVRDHHPPAGGATLCVDYKISEVFDLDDATKVLEEDGKILEISKTLTRYNCIDTGVFLCTTALMDALDSVLAEKGDASLSEGVSRLAAAGTMTVLDIGDAYWQDVDTPEMLAHAEALLAARTASNPR